MTVLSKTVGGGYTQGHREGRFSLYLWGHWLHWGTQTWPFDEETSFGFPRHLTHGHPQRYPSLSPLLQGLICAFFSCVCSVTFLGKPGSSVSFGNSLVKQGVKMDPWGCHVKLQHRRIYQTRKWSGMVEVRTLHGKPKGLANLLMQPKDALNIEDGEIDPTSDLDSSIKSDSGHIVESFCEEWVC